MKKILLVLAGIFALAACKQAEPDYASMKKPSIELMYSTLTPDLNRVDNTPVVCVIFSEAGLRNVKLYKIEGELQTLLKEIVTFKNAHQYSLKETPSWNTDITAIRIEATDNAGRMVATVLPVEVTPVLPAPEITFEKEIIRINEINEDPSTVTTRFTVTSSNTLESVKASLFTADGIVDVPLSPTFHVGESTYSFEQDVDYMEGYRGLQVSATDANGKMKIETLPVDYIPAPAPELIPGEGVSQDLLLVRSTDSKTFNFQVLAGSGLSSVEVVYYTKDEGTGSEVQNRLHADYYDATTTFEQEFSYSFESFDPAAYAIAFIAVDRLNHEVTYRIPTLVDLRYGTDLVLSAQRNTVVPLELEDYPGEQFYCFFSVRDFKTYSLIYWWEVANRRNIDFFYFAWNAGGTRLMRANENRDGQDPAYFQYSDGEVTIPLLGQWPTSGEGGRNGTVIHKLTNKFNFTFDNVTAADFTSAAVTAKMNDQGKASEDWLDFKAGDSFLFKTGPLSTYPNCVGIFRFDRIVGDRDSFSGNNAPPNDKPAYAVISIKTQIIE